MSLIRPGREVASEGHCDVSRKEMKQGGRCLGVRRGLGLQGAATPNRLIFLPLCLLVYLLEGGRPADETVVPVVLGDARDSPAHDEVVEKLKVALYTVAENAEAVEGINVDVGMGPGKGSD